MLSEWFKSIVPVMFINQSKGKPKPMVPHMRNFSRPLSKLHGIATNSEWFIVLFAPAMIGRSNYFGICFTILNRKSLYWLKRQSQREAKVKHVFVLMKDDHIVLSSKTLFPLYRE